MTKSKQDKQDEKDQQAVDDQLAAYEQAKKDSDGHYQRQRREEKERESAPAVEEVQE